MSKIEHDFRQLSRSPPVPINTNHLCKKYTRGKNPYNNRKEETMFYDKNDARLMMKILITFAIFLMQIYVITFAPIYIASQLSIIYKNPTIFIATVIVMTLLSLIGATIIIYKQYK